MATVAITDTGGLDFAAGLAALRTAGHHAVVLETDDARQILGEAPNCAALIVSFTRIGADVIAALPELKVIAAPLVGRIIAHDPYAADWPDGVQRVERDQVFSQADVVSLHAPATADTIGLVNEQLLATMRPGSYLVNVARGALVVEADLLAALDTGRLPAAFLDVTDPEPPTANSLLRRHPRVQLSPHSAFASTATLRDYVMIPVGYVLESLDAGG